MSNLRASPPNDQPMREDESSPRSCPALFLCETVPSSFQFATVPVVIRWGHAMKFGPIDEARQLMTAAGVPRLSPDDVRSLMSIFARDVESLLRLLVPLAAERAVIPISK
jgi:hypothetical protein